MLVTNADSELRAVDRTSKLVSARFYRKANKLAAQALLKVLIRTVPYKIHTILTDNGVQFSDLARTGEQVMVHPFTRLCWANGSEHRLTRPYHPWTNGQAERTVSRIKDATVHAFHYATIRALRRHIADWLAAYSVARQLKALRWRMPMEASTAVWRQKPDLFHQPTGHYSPGSNI